MKEREYGNMDGYTDVPEVTAADFEPTPIYDKVKGSREGHQREEG